MHNEETGWTEADITINGKALSLGQSMALRVAASSFLMTLSEPDALGDDDDGRGIAKGYKARMTEVMSMLHKTDK